MGRSGDTRLIDIVVGGRLGETQKNSKSKEQKTQSDTTLDPH